MLLVLFPRKITAPISHVFVGVENIRCRQVAFMIGLVEVRPRVGRIPPSIRCPGTKLSKVVPNLPDRPIIKTRLSQMNHSAIEVKLSAFNPKLTEAELLVELITHTLSRNSQPEGIEIWLVHIPQARVGPRPRNCNGLRWFGLPSSTRGERLFNLALLIEHFRDKMQLALLFNSIQIHIQSDVLFSGGSADKNIAYAPVGWAAFQIDTAS